MKKELFIASLAGLRKNKLDRSLTQDYSRTNFLNIEIERKWDNGWVKILISLLAT